MMKYILLFLWLLPCCLHAGDDDHGRLLIYAADCRKAAGAYSVDADTITLYRLPDEKLVLQKVGYMSMGVPMTIDSIVAGDYRLVSMNFFGQRKERYITIAAGSTEVRLCADSLVAYRSSSIDSLMDGERIVLTYFSSGCFHQIGEQIAITRQGVDLVAERYESGGGFDLKGDVLTLRHERGKRLQKVTLHKKGREAYGRFENELSGIEDKGRCTTTEWYQVSSPYLNVQKPDGDCQWNGYSYLKAALFGK